MNESMKRARKCIRFTLLTLESLQSQARVHDILDQKHVASLYVDGDLVHLDVAGGFRPKV